MTMIDLVAVLLYIILLIIVISEMNFLIIILCITVSATICFITYFFFKLVKKLVGSFIYYKTYNYNLSFKNRINNLKRIILFMNLENFIDSL